MKKRLSLPIPFPNRPYSLSSEIHLDWTRIRTVSVLMWVLLLGCSLAGVRGACLPPPAGLISWWTGDDQALDWTGVNHGTLGFGATFTEGKVGRAFQFDGVDDIIQTQGAGLAVRLKDFTIQGWAKTTSKKAWNTLVEFEGHAPALYITGETGALQLWPAGGTTTGGFNDGQFHHFAVTRKEGAISYFKDGILIGTNLYTGDIFQHRFFIGSDTVANDVFSGAIDEIGVFDRALLPDEIQRIVAAGSDGMCKPASPPYPAASFFIEAEDFDFSGGQHRPVAGGRSYGGGAYAELPALGGIDFHDPGLNESAVYRPISQGVATTPNWDTYRDGGDMIVNYKVGWNDAGDWMNYTRRFPTPVKEYNIYARLASAGLPTAVQLDEVISGHKGTNQVLAKIGRAGGSATGGWDAFAFFPVVDDAGNPVKVALEGERTIRLTMLPGGNEDINYLQFVPVQPPSTQPCVTTQAGLAGWWPGDGNTSDAQGTNQAILKNGTRYDSGKVNEGFIFDGVDDYVETTLDVQPAAMPVTTWEAWIFPTRIAGRQQILSSDDGNYDRSVLLEGGSFGVFTGFGVWYPVGVSFNQWQHIAVVFSSTNVDFFKNGVRFSIGSGTAGQGTTHKLQVGRNPGFGEYYQGRIDEVSIYSRGLSPAEIQAIYSAGSAGKCKSAQPAPKLMLGSTSLNFGTVAAGETALLSLSISNAGNASLTIESATVNPGPFAATASGLPLRIAAGMQSEISVAFHPTTAGSFTGTLVLSANDPALPAPRISLTGTGSPGEVLTNLLADYRFQNQLSSSVRTPPPLAEIAAGNSFINETVDGTNRTVFSFARRNGLFLTNALTLVRDVYTVAILLRLDELGSYKRILSFLPTDPDSGLYTLNSVLTYFRPTLAGTTAFKTNAFAQVVLTRDAAKNVAGYVDGKREFLLTDSQDAAIVSSASLLRFFKDDGAEDTSGSVARIRIYNTALSMAEVARLDRLPGVPAPPATNGVPEFRLFPASLNFGEVKFGESRDLTVTVTNAGGGVLSITSLSVNNSRFLLVSPTNGFNLLAGEQRTVTVRYTWSNKGADSGSLLISHNDNTKPIGVVSLLGSGETPLPPEIEVSPLNHDFGEVVISRQAELDVAVQNLGGGPLTIKTLSTFNDVFSLVSPAAPIIIPASGSNIITVRYTPKAAQFNLGNLNIQSDDSNESSLFVTLQGRGVAQPALLSVNPSSASSGAQVVLTGTNFSTNPLESTVRFGAMPASVIRASRTELVVSTPYSVVGSAPITVARQGVSTAPLPFQVVPASGAPARLNARLRPPNELTLSWAAALSNLTVESTPNLKPPVQWQPAQGQVAVSGGEQSLALPLGGLARFFRLKGSGNPSDITVTSGHGSVRPDTGGTISASDNTTTLVVPAGAVSTNVDVAVTHYQQLDAASNTVAGVVLLAPDGLGFKTPATVTIKAPEAVRADQNLELFLFSESNTATNLGSEISQFQPLTNFTVDPAAGSFTVQVPHFSAILYMFERKESLYVVFDIPGSHLKKGDLLYVLTGSGSWVPGHTGLYLGTKNPLSSLNDGTTVIESTPKDVRFKQFVDGVQFGELVGEACCDFIRLSGQHVYMGARRPRFEITDEERTRLARWAVARLFVPYSKVGGPFVFTGDFWGDLSCVGLTEGAYESIGKSIVPGLREAFLLPLTQFNLTRAVDQVYLGPGDTYNMAVRGVAKPGFLQGYNDSLATVTLETEPDSAADRAFKAGRAALFGQIFRFNPSSEDAELTCVFKFRVNAPGIGEKTSPFFITVTNKPAPVTYIRQDPPTIQVDTANFAGDLTVNKLEAHVSASSGNIKINWTEPPLQITSGTLREIEFEPVQSFEAPDIVSFSDLSPASPRRLYADLLPIDFESDTEHAFIGYTQPVEPCNSGRCYRVAKRAWVRAISPETTGFSVTVHITAYGGLTFGGPGQRKATVTWKYIKQP